MSIKDDNLCGSDAGYDLEVFRDYVGAGGSEAVSKQTYDEFRNKYNRRVKLPYNENVDDLRQTSLEDSILDLYMCMHSYKFKGSGWSSFSELIELKRVENLEKYSYTSS